MNYNEIFYMLALIFIFYTLGIVLSNIINYVFPTCDFNKEDKLIIIECGIQMFVIYFIFFKFNEKIRNCVAKIFHNLMNKNMNDLVLTIVIIAFSSGVFKHLKELNEKTRYIKEKYFG